MGFLKWYAELNANQKKRTNLQCGSKKIFGEREKVSIFLQLQSLEEIPVENKILGNIWRNQWFHKRLPTEGKRADNYIGIHRGQRKAGTWMPSYSFHSPLSTQILPGPATCTPQEPPLPILTHTDLSSPKLCALGNYVWISSPRQLNSRLWDCRAHVIKILVFPEHLDTVPSAG